MDGILKKTVKRLRIKGSEIVSQDMDDPVAVEKRLRIIINGKEVLKLYCTPIMIREMITGFLMTEELIKGSWCADRMSIEYGDDIVVDIPSEGEVSLEGATITSGCAGGITLQQRYEKIQDFSLRVNPERLRSLFSEFQARSLLYRDTGCIHSAAVATEKYIIAFAEDIGRHNAVDKVIGFCLLENIDLQDKIVFASGRLSSEMVSKCARWLIPVVVSRTAPTTRALEIAEEAGMTIIGFMRGDRFNVYTHPQRLLGLE